MGIGRRIKEARELADLTQKELAGLVNITPSAITNYEKEVSHPKDTILYDLMKTLNVDANFLFQDVVDLGDKKTPTTTDVARAYEIILYTYFGREPTLKELQAFEKALPILFGTYKAILEQG